MLSLRRAFSVDDQAVHFAENSVGELQSARLDLRSAMARDDGPGLRLWITKDLLLGLNNDDAHVIRQSLLQCKLKQQLLPYLSHYDGQIKPPSPSSNEM